MPFCPTEEMAGDPDCEVAVRDGVIFADEEPLVAHRGAAAARAHNVENAMAAAAAALAIGLDRDAVAEGLRSFEGVPHRLERVRELGGVLYVNDSKATNVASALAGIDSFDGGLHLILGGSLKGETFEPLVEPVSERCRAVYLIGEAADQLAAELAPVAARGVSLERPGTLEAAVAAAAKAAQPGEVVLLSPACASFDALRGLRGARRALPRAGGGAGMSLLSGHGTPKRRSAPPLEYSLLLTATLCLLAIGAVMVFSASSATSLLAEGGGDGFYYLKRTLLFAGDRACSRFASPRVNGVRASHVPDAGPGRDLAVPARLRAGARGRADASTARSAGSGRACSASSPPSSPRSR